MPGPRLETTKKPPQRRLPFDQRHEQLLDIAEELFVTRGYSSVAMGDIASAAGVTRPIVYSHFETKEGAYIACVRRAREDYDLRLLTRIDPSLSPREQLAQAGDSFFAMVEDNPGRWLLLFGSNAVLAGEHNEILADLRFNTIDNIVDRLRPFAMKGVPDSRIEAAAHAVSGVGERLGHWWLRDPSMSRAELVEHYVEVLWMGLGPFVNSKQPKKKKKKKS